MTDPVTVAEIRAALAAGRLSAPDFLRARWHQLYRSNEQSRDPAWISLASASQ